MVYYATLFCFGLHVDHANREALYCAGSVTETIFLLYWCKLDETALKSQHLYKTTTWSRLTNPSEITLESHPQKLGQTGNHQHQGRKKFCRAAFPADTFWDATRSGARPLHKCLWGSHSVLHVLYLEMYLRSTSTKCSFVVTRLHKLSALPSIFPKIAPISAMANLPLWAV